MITVIIPTCDRPRELHLVLEGLRRQEGPEFDIVIGDDGSGPETRETIEKVREGYPRSIEHVYQEDRGFRAAAVRNRAIERARGDYLIFLDGDCVPLPGFIRAHGDAREEGRYLTGQRMRLDGERSRALTPERIGPGHASLGERLREAGETWRALVHRLQGRSDRPKLLTCNASVSREAIEAINGLDERFVGWGGEDDDIGRRLRRSGVLPKSVVGKARILHLHHPPVPSFRGKVRLGDNYDYLHRGYYLTRCRSGLMKRSMRDLEIGWDKPGEWEVEVITPGSGRASFHPESEVRVLVIGEDPPPDLAGSCHIALLLEGATWRSEKPSATIPDDRQDTILAALDPLL